MLEQVQDSPKIATHIPRFRTQVIFLRPGESATRLCGRFVKKEVFKTLRRCEVLVAICRHTRRRFVFVCGRRRGIFRRRVRTIFLPRGTAITVRCRKW